MIISANAANDEQARVREWLLRAKGFLPGTGKPRPMPTRDIGGIIGDRQSRSRWQRGTGLEIRGVSADESTWDDDGGWLAHLAYALRWADAALAAADDPRLMADWSSPEYREMRLALITANAQGYVGLADKWLPQEIDADLRRELMGEDVEDLVLGYAERSGEWVPGLAGIAERDAEAFRWSLGVRSPACKRPEREHRGGLRCLFEVRDLCDRRQQGRRRGMPLSIETIENRLSAARAGLRRWADQVRAGLAGQVVTELNSTAGDLMPGGRE